MWKVFLFFLSHTPHLMKTLGIGQSEGQKVLRTSYWKEPSSNTCHVKTQTPARRPCNPPPYHWAPQPERSYHIQKAPAALGLLWLATWGLTQASQGKGLESRSRVSLFCFFPSCSQSIYAYRYQKWYLCSSWTDWVPEATKFPQIYQW